MRTANISSFVLQLQTAARKVLKAKETLATVLFRLVCFLSRVDRTAVDLIKVEDYEAELPMDLSPGSLYNWVFKNPLSVRKDARNLNVYAFTYTYLSCKAVYRARLRDSWSSSTPWHRNVP